MKTTALISAPLLLAFIHSVLADYEILFLEGDAAPAPGGGADGTFKGYTGQAAVNPTSGDLVAVGTYEPSFQGAIWSLEQGSTDFASVARSGDPAPGVIPAADFTSIASPLFPTGPVNASGKTAFLVATTDGEDGIWFGDAGGLTLVALEGDPVTAIGGGVQYLSPGPPVLNDSGHVAFKSKLQIGSSDWVILAGPPGSLTVAARQNTPAPGAPAGTTFGFTAFDLDPMIDSDGNICFNAATSGPVTSGIWSGPPAGIQPLILQGDPAPGLTTGSTFGSFSTPTNIPSWTGAQFAFRMDLVDDDGTNRDGIWAGTSGSLNLVAATGFNAPPPFDMIPINELIGNPVLSASGHIAFRARLDPGHPDVTTSTDDIICYGPLGSVEVILRAGDQAPGLPAGNTMTTLGIFNEFEMAPDGRLAFTMSRTANTTPTIWIAKPGGAIDLIAAKDLTFDDRGDTWTIDSSAINFLNSGTQGFNFDQTGFNGSDGRPGPFGPHGEFAFTCSVAPSGSGNDDPALLRYRESAAEPESPTITIITGVPGPNDVRIQVESVLGQDYSVERSTDGNRLDPWSPVGSTTAGTGGTLLFDDLGTLLADKTVIYRAVTEFP